MFTDHLQRQISVPAKPQRIVSLCPSLTETLYALGLGAQVVGRTRFCIHPAQQVHKATRVGGTKQIDYARLDALTPDLIIAEKEENTPDMVEHLGQRYPVYVFDIETVAQATAMIGELGQLTGASLMATPLQQAIKTAWHLLPQIPPPARVAYLIWQDPLMVAGHDTYLQSVLTQLGFDNVFLGREERYPPITLDELRAAEPDWVLLSSEPYPFAASHREAFAAELPGARVELVDGEMFSWYGARMLEAVPWFRDWLRRMGVEQPASEHASK
jgi:ABC-type Fe3+-hydroxamate transport system substrate-binding protein